MPRNPEFDRPPRRVIRADGPGRMWIGAAIAALIVVAAVAWGFGTDTSKTATAPGLTTGAPAETTGTAMSGIERPAQPMPSPRAPAAPN
jgi:hypothetical protein